LLAGLGRQPVEELAQLGRVLRRVVLDLLVDDEGHLGPRGYRFLGPRLTSSVTEVPIGCLVPGTGAIEITLPFLTSPEYLRLMVPTVQFAAPTRRRATLIFRRATGGTRQTTGCGASAPFSRTVTDFPARFAVTRSSAPSPFRSSMASATGALPTLTRSS